jgi:uncharacterized membrane protein
MTLLGILAAFVAGVVIAFQTESLPIGLFSGIGIGFVLARLQTLTQAVARLQTEIGELRRAQAAPPAAVAASAAVPLPTVQEPRSSTDPAGPLAASSPERAASSPAPTITQPPATPPPAPLPPGTEAAPPAPRAPSLAENLAAALKRWFTEGNVPVKIGMLVLFAGVAALLKLASDQGWLSVPIELRLAAVAAAAIAGLAFGWRQRHRRRSFALGLQGGTIGVLLLTVFAAFRLYGLLPPGAAFALMLVLVAGAGVLAVLQDSLALAVLGILAGFAAPILISTGGGNHVVLFAYYALLNLAVLAIAWLRPWRALNLLGFFFTYAIGTAWGVLRYRSELFDSTEPFLLIYFAIYLAIPVLYARRREPQQRDLVDGTLVFGNPLVAFGLQAALLEGARLPLAYSALGLAAIYAVLAWRLLPRERLRVLGESFAVLAVGFATLAVPLALSARSTACTFALEGAALVWLGLRQGRLLPRLSGLLLQALAAAAFGFGLVVDGHAGAMPIANGNFVGALLIAGAALVSAWLHARAPARPPLALPLYLWGLAWWLGAGLGEIDRFVDPSLQVHAAFAFVSLTGLLAALAWRRLSYAALAWTAAAMIAVALLFVLDGIDASLPLYRPAPLAALAAYAVCGGYALRVLRDGQALPLRIAHLCWLWTWTVAASLVLSQLAVRASLADGWRVGLAALPLIAAFALVLRRPAALAAPIGARFEEHRAALLLSQAAVSAVAFLALLSHAGAAAPLPFVPLLNPVELAQIGLLLCLARWISVPSAVAVPTRLRSLPLAVAGFVFVTMATLRAVHHYEGVPWGPTLWDSNLAQTALTVVWSLGGVLAWIHGSRRGQRALWLAGAVLMGLVLAKLLLIDRLRLGNLFGIASFIAYGLLCTVIGYFAPAPARAPAEKEPA